MQTLSAFLLGEKNKLHSGNSWLVLIEIELAASTVRVVDDVQSFTWNGNIYYPAAIQVGDHRQTSDGSLETLTLSVANMSRDLSAMIENGEFDDKTTTLRVVNSASALSDDSLIQSFGIMSVSMSWKQVDFQLGHVNLFNRPFPKNRVSRSRCRKIYRSIACGYIGSLISCDKTLDGDNGCRIHGVDEVSAALPKIHPKNYGGFPAIPDER